jgi:hypothetical protein
MKLTKLDREAFVASVLSDVPTVDYSELIRKTVQQKAVALLPVAARTFHKTYPHLVRLVTLYQLPVRCGTVNVVGESGDLVLKAMQADSEFWASLEKMSSDARAQVAARDALENKLAAAIGACTTLEQAHERMPEFAKYLKNVPVADRSVPVVADLVASLTAAGWPAGKKPAAKRA